MISMDDEREEKFNFYLEIMVNGSPIKHKYVYSNENNREQVSRSFERFPSTYRLAKYKIPVK